MPKDIRHEWFFSQTPQEVWNYLTKPELMEQWLMKTDFQPAIGHDFQFRTNPIPDFNFDGVIHCKVLEIIPFKKLTYSWKSGPGGGKITVDSIVAWTLHSTDKGTKLSLLHSGFSDTEEQAIYAGMHAGWLKNMQKIETLLKAASHGASNA